jgi:hypothetical protein
VVGYGLSVYLSDFSYHIVIDTLSVKDKGKGKIVPVLFLNRAPRHEGVLGSGYIAPRILGLGTRWR